MNHIVIVVEDEISKAVLEKIISENRSDLTIHTTFGMNGFGFIKKNIPRFINASRAVPHIILTDLDREECAPSLIKKWIGAKRFHTKCMFRVAEKEIEAWLIADKESFSKFSGVNLKHIPINVDSIKDPKQELLNIFRKSKLRRLARSILPEEGSIVKIGPGYNEELCKFVQEKWRSKIAEQSSESLKRTVLRINQFLK